MDKPDKEERTYSKTDSRYWTQAAGRLFKDHGAADYSCRFSVKGKRGQLCLGTPNMKTAAKKAAAAVILVMADGWDAAFKLYRAVSKEAKPEGVTVGAVIAAATATSSARRRSIEGYGKALRLIVSEIAGIDAGNKFDAKHGGSAKWRAHVDAVDLNTIAPADVLAWKNARLRAAEGDALAKRSAIVTANSLIRNAKCLFGKKILPFIEEQLPLPKPLLFDGVHLDKMPSLRYVSRIDPKAILEKAEQDLAVEEPEAFKVLILALVLGLRRAEIDHLLWSTFDFSKATLRVETSEYHELKSEDSAGTMDLDPDILALFKRYRVSAPRAVFVVESPLEPNPKAKVGWYRCNPVFDKVIAWLRENGVDGHKPIHTLRKEIGSIIAAEHGIFAASRYLRHANIHITSAFYADKKNVVTPAAFSGLLGVSKAPDQKAPKKTAKKGSKRKKKGVRRNPES